MTQKVCCTKDGKKTCKEYTDSPAGRAACNRAAAKCKEEGGKARKSSSSPPPAMKKSSEY